MLLAWSKGLLLVRGLCLGSPELPCLLRAGWELQARGVRDGVKGMWWRQGSLGRESWQKKTSF